MDARVRRRSRCWPSRRRPSACLIPPQAVYTDQTENIGNTFGAAPSFEERTYYLHDDPTPPVGDTTARLLLTADQVVPTAQTLYNYSADLDSEPGRHLDEAGYDKNRTDPAEAVAWRLPPTTELPAPRWGNHGRLLGRPGWIHQHG